MFKSLVTLFRGAAHDVAETVTDRNALSILDQQMRDCTLSVARARKALAVAIAQDGKEQAHIEHTRKRIADLEERAGLALDEDRQDLAAEAAEAIAYLEAECEAGETAQSTFAAEIKRLRKIVKQSELRLVELRRGQRIVVAAEKAKCLRGDEVAPSQMSINTLAEAEQTLTRLRERQKDFERTAVALEELDPSADPSSLVERFAEAGIGRPVRSTPEDVLARLKARRTAGHVPALKPTETQT